MIVHQNAVTRSTNDVKVTLTWPSDGPPWDELPAVTRNQIREHLDAATDLIEHRLVAAP